MSRIRVVVPVYERPDFLDACLSSLETQDHADFDVTIVDDASPDPTVDEIAHSYADRLGWTALRLPERNGALATRTAGVALAAPADDEIIVFVDGDDSLLHDGALAAIDSAIGGDVWMTSGGMRCVATSPEREARAAGLADLLVDRRAMFEANRDQIASAASYRRMPWCFSAPLAFRAFLWYAIDQQDFRLASGRWIHTATDLAFLFPLLELSGGRITLLDDEHYRYNLHPGNHDAEPHLDRGRLMMRRLLASRTPYTALDPALVPECAR